MDKLEDGILNCISKFVEKQINDVQIDIMVSMIAEANLSSEFEKFIDSEENHWTNAETYFFEFAKLYPDKFYIVPEDQRQNIQPKIIVVEND